MKHRRTVILLVLSMLSSVVSASIVWDGTLWFYSDDPSDLFVNADGDLEWEPEGGEQFITRIPDIALNQVEDVVEISYMWMTDGQHNCPDCFDCDLYCHDNDITCIAGTSDIRVGLFEADGEYVEEDGFEVTGSSIFTGYKGYIFRFGPNMLAGPTRWVDCTDEVHKTGQFCKKPEDRGDLMYVNDGLMEPLPGLELPPGEYALFTVRLRRTGSSAVEMTISLGDKTYSYTDNSSTDQPSKIDVIAVHMRNHRPYNRLVLGKVCLLGPANLNGDDIVDGNDLAILANDWLLTGDSGSPPDANQLVLYYDFDGTLGSDVPTGLVDNTGTYTASIIPGSDGNSSIRYAEPNPIYNTEETSAQFDNDNWGDNAGDTFLIPDATGIDFSSFSEFTVGLFVNPSASGSGQTRRIFSEDIYAYMYLDGGNTLHAIRKWGGGGWDENWTHLTRADLPLDSWSHVAMTWDSDAAGDKFKLYVDGEPAASTAGTSTATIDSSAGFAIGGYQHAAVTKQFFHGKIDEFALYSYALSAGEIAYIGNNAQTPPASPANLFNDGIIDFKDFASFAPSWLDSCE